MTLNELLALIISHRQAQVPAVCLNSRLVGNGDIFVALKGTVYDGHDFIDQAIVKEAEYVVCQQKRIQETGNRIQNTCKFIFVDDSAQAAALLAQAVKGNPASQLTNLAVTGTNGKTTVAYLVRCCFCTAGQKCGLIGTVEYDTGSVVCESVLTTPDCLEIARIQQQMVETGTKHMVIEASSHALSQNRLAGINFTAAAFTNLSGDHLDYHKTKDDYFSAKTLLFSGLSPDSTAVLNRQSPESEHIAEKTGAKILWYDIERKADISAHIESMDIDGTVFTLHYAGQKQRVKSSLPGRHNVSNHLAAAGLCLAAGLDLETIAAGLSALQTIPGRLEKVKWNLLTAESNPAINCGAKYLAPRFTWGFSSAVKQGDFSVIIDYAHTDDALKNVLSTLKPLCKGRLILVFGCGGDRDRSKRPRMGRAAEQWADIVIVTSDNPRTEEPMAIIEEIIAGFEKEPVRDASCVMRRAKNERNTQYAIRNTKLIEPDRRKAIELAIKTASRDDIVLIAGKGHENYQIIGTQKFAFSDKTVARNCLKRRI